MSYARQELRSPRLTGAALRTFVSLAEAPLISTLLRGQMLGLAGIPAWRRTRVDEAPEARPVFGAGDRSEGRAPDLQAVVAQTPARPPFETVRDFAQAYREGRATPSEVAERLLAAIEDSERLETPLRVFIRVDAEGLRRQAEAATGRLRAGQALGPLDGVPVAIKDELDVEGLPTTVGTGFLGRQPAASDATVVARLRAAGALIIGKANMHEVGIGVTGVNQHHGTCRNPYDPTRKTGGSSSGSAAAVAAGFCPLAVGADGGGSIRTPAALCGVYGLKPSFGRVSEHGAAPLCWSVAHVGPIAASASDLALGYAVMAGADPADPNTLSQPAPHLADFTEPHLEGVRVGVYRPWFEDAEPELVALCRAGLERMQALGAELVDVEIPELGNLQLAHTVTIVSEMLEAMRDHLDRPARFGYDVRLNFALGLGFTAADYVHAQRWRARARAILAPVYERVDLVATPTCGMLAPPIRDAGLDGESDLVELNTIMRYVTLGNLTGLPAVAIPVGLSTGGLPASLQLMARGWHEHLLLRSARALETTGIPAAPRWHAQLLPATP